MKSFRDQKVTQASDIMIIDDLFQEILGEICWKVHLGYGDELRLEIGARLPYSLSSIAGQEKGPWMLGVKESDWVLYSSVKKVVSSKDVCELIQQRIHDIDDARITAFKIGYPKLNLKITLSNGLMLNIAPILDDRSFQTYWELFTPHSMLLKIGPDMT